MRVLWIVNMILPYVAKKIGIKETSFGGWLNGLYDELKKRKNIELAIATVYNGKELLKFCDEENVTYYLIPGAPALKYDKRLEKYWINVNEEFKPDIVHIHGTEYAHGLAFQKALPNTKTIVSIQGLTSVCADVYYGNISVKNILKNITIRDILKMDNLFQAKKKMAKRGKNEIEILKKANVILGRTTWDYANVKAINDEALYCHSNENLRETFYNRVWKEQDIQQYTVFSSQATSPIKGLHYLIEALHIVKKKYPNVLLRVAGYDITSNRYKISGYGKYIRELIKKYELTSNIIFTGILNEEQMADELLKTHVFVLPSAIENSSNSLGEAMLLGMPCVASNTGGTMDILKHKQEGLLYPYTEPAILAEYITKYFNDIELCKNYGVNARNTALERHNRENNAQNIVKIYEEQYRGEK